MLVVVSFFFFLFLSLSRPSYMTSLLLVCFFNHTLRFVFVIMVISLSSLILYCVMFVVIFFFCMLLFQGNVTFACAEPVSVAVTFPGPQSFLQLPGVMASSQGGLSIAFQFRTWNKAGLLLTFDLPQQGGAVWLYLSEARLRLQIHKAGRSLLELSAGQGLPKP